MAVELVYPYIDPIADVLPLVQGTATMQRVATFTNATTPNLTQVEAYIRGAAGYVTRRLAGAGYCTPLEPRDGETEVDEATADLVKYLTALVAAGMVMGYHVPGDRGPRLGGYGAQAEMMLDDLQAGNMLLGLCSKSGSIASAAYQAGGVPYWADAVAESGMSVTAYALYRIGRYGVDGTLRV